MKCKKCGQNYNVDELKIYTTLEIRMDTRGFEKPEFDIISPKEGKDCKKCGENLATKLLTMRLSGYNIPGDLKFYARNGYIAIFGFIAALIITTSGVTIMMCVMYYRSGVHQELVNRIRTHIYLQNLTSQDYPIKIQESSVQNIPLPINL